MDSTEAYVNKLIRLKQDAAKVLDAIKDEDSETVLENAVNSACEEIRTTYIREAKTLTDEIAQRKLRELDRESSKLGPMIVTAAYGAIAGLLASKAGESESARRFVKPAIEAYQMDETTKTRIIQSSESAKNRVQEQALSMKLEDFMKSLKGGKALHKSLKAFREELDRLP